jgi:hypothetical protein
MYNPNQCSDFDCEWLELYNNDSVGINLTNWTISGNLIGNMFLLPNEYILIARELVDGADNDTESFEVAWGNGDGVWGNSPQENYNALQVSISLTNSDNTAINLTNGVEADLITYNLSMGGNGNGRTLCRYPDGYQTLVECVATPGMPNTLVTNVTNPTNVTSNNATCDLKLSISTGSDIYNAAETLNYDIIVNDTICANQSHSVVIEYSIEDLFGQLTSITPRNTTPQDIVCYKSIAKHWTSPNFTGSEAYMIKAKITDSGCNETNSENNNASQIVIVKGSQQDIGSAITITKVNVGSDNTVKFGESADVDLEVYRGDTNKYAIDVYVKDSSGNKISAVSTFHANSKFASYDLSIPVQIKTNCDGEFADSTYTVIAEGLDTYATASVSVAGVSSSTCKTITVSSSSSSSGAVLQVAVLVRQPHWQAITK